MTAWGWLQYTFLRLIGQNRRTPKMSWLDEQNRRVLRCDRCPRLRKWCTEVAQQPRAAFRGQTYHAKPVPSFGDPDGSLLIVGLAPAAHGANRTGRMFTGDRSGDFLYAALYRAGFANQPTATSRDDGLTPRGCLITAVCRCAPPNNKPTPEEIRSCRPFLIETMQQMPWRAILALGSIAWSECLRCLDLPRVKFHHGAEIPVEAGKTVFASYHPSQQNTFTGRLTFKMFDEILHRIRKRLDG